MSQQSQKSLTAIDCMEQSSFVAAQNCGKRPALNEFDELIDSSKRRRMCTNLEGETNDALG